MISTEICVAVRPADRLGVVLRGTKTKTNKFSRSDELNSAMSASYVIKIYLPDTGRPGKFLYGYKKTEAKVQKAEGGSKTVVSYFFLTSSDKAVRTTLPILGFYGNDDIFEVNLIADDSGEFMKVKLNNGEFKQNYRVLMFHYDRKKFLSSFDEAYSERSLQDNCAVYIAQSLKSEHKREHGESYKKKVTRFSHRLLLAFAAVTSTILKPLSLLFNNTVTYRHCCNWRQCLVDERSHKGFIVLDVLLGIALFLLMSHVQHTGRYFMLFTEFIVNKLRALLEMLDGSPAGLKLNVQLNNFLLSCFMYHVDLWWNFIRIVEPAIHYIFYPITAFGLMGFSFQCAMLCDVVTLITLHAHCFYIYAAMLYKLELYSIRALLRIVLGRRLNVLKSEFFLRFMIQSR